MQTIFISDLHLDPSRPEITGYFLDLLAKEALVADALYILGDFFEVWVGDDDQSELINAVKKALHRVTQTGVPVYFMHGNRDFLMGAEFMRQTGCQLLDDPTLISLYGVPTLLAHGDALCTDDEPYIRFRAKARNVNYQRIFLSLPLWIRKAVARLLRKLSQKQARDNNYKFIDANFAEVKRVMAQYGAQALIHGHTHCPSMQYFHLLGQTVCRVVLSDWEETGNMLIVEQDGTRRLLAYPK